jgi:hypothetical protein
MNAQSFIQSRLEGLSTPRGLEKPGSRFDLEKEILRLLLSKKFRKYSANEALIKHCRTAIAICVKNQKPINITFLHGAYKLWRLEESPEADWAELFSLIYYTDWVKGICEIYEPGVHFDFFVDDYIVPELDNIPPADVETYLVSYQHVIDFLRPYQPINLQMTVTRVGSQFASQEDFKKKLEQGLEEAQVEDIPTQLTEEQVAMIDLNVKVTEKQAQDPQWREKVWQLHNVYLRMKKETGYHVREDKILAFTQPLASGTTLSVGTTKASVAKFWVGVGALKKKNETHQEVVLSVSQLTKSTVKWEDVSFDGLSGKNFKKIHILI